MRRLAWLIVFLVVLVGVVLFIPDAHLPPVELTPEDNAPVTAELTVSAVGDCVLGTDSRFPPDDTFVAAAQNNPPNYFFGGVAHLLGTDDLTLANLETTLTKSDHRIDKDLQERPFWFRGDPSYAQLLREGSIEAVSVANNHTHDYGQEGFDDTVRHLRGAGVGYYGYEHVDSVTIKGLRVAVLGFNQLGVNEEGVEPEAFASSVVNRIEEVRPGADVIVASVHWGEEYSEVPTPEQVDLAHRAVDAGADLVLGHHPHVIQGIELYHGRIIAYSLGNFVYGGSRAVIDDGDTMVLEVTFDFEQGTLERLDHEITMVAYSGNLQQNDYRPEVLEGARKTAARRKLEERTVLAAHLAEGLPPEEVEERAAIRERMFEQGVELETPRIVTADQIETAGADDLVHVTDIVPDIVLEFPYATPDNVAGKRLYYRTYPYLRHGTAQKLAHAQELAQAQGYGLKLWDGYRPPEVQWLLWEYGPDPRFLASPLEGYSAHNRGAAVDVTLVDASGRELPMPSGFDEFSAKADKVYGDVTEEQAHNSRLLENIMQTAGFVWYYREWWHYRDSDSSTYGVVDIHRTVLDLHFSED